MLSVHCIAALHTSSSKTGVFLDLLSLCCFLRRLIPRARLSFKRNLWLFEVSRPRVLLCCFSALLFPMSSQLFVGLDVSTPEQLRVEQHLLLYLSISQILLIIPGHSNENINQKSLLMR